MFLSMRKWTVVVPICSLMRQSCIVQSQTSSDSAVAVKCKCKCKTARKAVHFTHCEPCRRHISIFLWRTFNILWFTVEKAFKACQKLVPVSALSMFVWVRAACDISERIFRAWTRLKFSDNVWVNFGYDVNQYVPLLALAFHQCLTPKPKQPLSRRFMITR